jgi:hypothetical protein
MARSEQRPEGTALGQGKRDNPRPYTLNPKRPSPRPRALYGIVLCTVVPKRTTRPRPPPREFESRFCMRAPHHRSGNEKRHAKTKGSLVEARDSLWVRRRTVVYAGPRVNPTFPPDYHNDDVPERCALSARESARCTLTLVLSSYLRRLWFQKRSNKNCQAILRQYCTPLPSPSAMQQHLLA